MKEFSWHLKATEPEPDDHKPPGTHRPVLTIVGVIWTRTHRPTSGDQQQRKAMSTGIKARFLCSLACSTTPYWVTALGRTWSQGQGGYT